MPATKKRRKLPEEDLAAAVAEIINSPITRSNLSFLQSTSTDPSGLVVLPMGLASDPAGDGARTLWQAEILGTVFEQTRVRPIQQADDALSSVEKQVYDLFWGSKSGPQKESRLVHFSLRQVAASARLNIKTVRELLPRLIEKGFLRLEHPADVRRNIPTLYRVFHSTYVLEDQKRRNRLYIAKAGKGVFYVHPVAASIRKPMVDTPTPMGLYTRPSGVSISGYTASLSTHTALVTVIREALGIEPDATQLAEMLSACQQNAMQTTGEPASEEELLYFTAAKAGILARAPNIRNHLAVLIRAVPECFLGEAFRAYRAAATAGAQITSRLDP